MTSDYAIAWVTVFLILAPLGILFADQFPKSPKWIHICAATLRAGGRLVEKLCAIVIGVIVLWYGGIEVLIWLVPESRYGYAFKYADSAEQVFVTPKPHDCEWGKAPIGSKYCHFERHISFEKDEQGRTKAVYVTWEKVQD